MCKKNYAFLFPTTPKNTFVPLTIFTFGLVISSQPKINGLHIKRQSIALPPTFLATRRGIKLHASETDSQLTSIRVCK